MGIVPGVTTWTGCPVPLTSAINREIDPQGEVQDWVLVTTAPHWSAEQTRSTYELRLAIEERHYKCFWDLARMTPCHFSLVLTQVLFLSLAYTLLQGHLFLRHREEVNRRARLRTLQLLGRSLEVIATYYQQRFCLLSLPEFAEILLCLEGSPHERSCVRESRHQARPVPPVGERQPALEPQGSPRAGAVLRCPAESLAQLSPCTRHLTRPALFPTSVPTSPGHTLQPPLKTNSADTPPDKLPTK